MRNSLEEIQAIHSSLLREISNIFYKSYTDFVRFIIFCNGSALVAVLAFIGTTLENFDSIPLLGGLICFGSGLIIGLIATAFQIAKNKLRLDQLQAKLYYPPHKYVDEATNGKLLTEFSQPTKAQTRLLWIANTLEIISIILFISGMIIGSFELRTIYSNRIQINNTSNYSFIYIIDKKFLASKIPL